MIGSAMNANDEPSATTAARAAAVFSSVGTAARTAAIRTPSPTPQPKIGTRKPRTVLR